MQGIRPGISLVPSERRSAGHGAVRDNGQSKETALTGAATHMARNEANETLALTSFLYGGNADYIEDLYARYENDAAAVPPEWAEFFGSLKDDKATVLKNAEGASWAKPHWPIAANGDLVSALDGNWPATPPAKGGKPGAAAKPAANGAAPVAAEAGLSQAAVLQATRDSTRALMLIRAFRVRGHLHAKLDPLGIAAPLDDDYNELSPKAYGFTEADYDRKIFIDNVLGMEFATLRQIVDILTRTYCSTIGIEFMHISNPVEKAWLQERIEGPDKGVAFTPEGKRAILTS